MTFPSLSSQTTPGSFDFVTSPVSNDSAEAHPTDQHRSCDPLPRNCTSIWDVPFDRLDMGQAIDRIGDLIHRGLPSYVITANLNYVMLHHAGEGVPAITEDADMILADGQPIVWRSRATKTPLPTRVAGSEMIYRLAERAALEGWRIYFLGGVPGVAADCAAKLTELYPAFQIAGVESPPFRELSAEEQAEQDQRIREAGTDVLLVAFGQPKGERWIHQHYQRLGVPVSIQLGASFDFVAGTATRAPVIWQRAGMEWAYRMFSDPRRLIPRYAANAAFLARALCREFCDRLATRTQTEPTVDSHDQVPKSSAMR
ncbi:MAG: WecB/TagA/CpsF family glycosyltransferase [Planctomycetota bacterium]